MAIQQVLDLQIFRYENSEEFRTYEKDGEIWFYATDVCKILEIKNPSSSLALLDDDEKMTLHSMEGEKTDGRKAPPSTYW